MIALSLLALAFWLALSLDRSRAWPREHRLAEPNGDEREPIPVVAVVAARDEAAVLSQTLPSLLEQELAGVVLVDDGSTDGTSALASRLAQEAGRGDRLVVVAAPAAPSGASGKVNAQAFGVRVAAERIGEQAEWILLTDADIRHRPDSVGALLDQAMRGEDGPFDMVSVMARLRARSHWERLLIPPFVFFFQLLYPFRRVSRPGTRVAAAAGGCVLVKRRILAQAGGLESILDEVIDDVALARAIRAAGGRLWLGLDPGIVSVRAYDALAPIWTMVARTAFVQLQWSYWLLLATVLGLALVVVAPPILVALAAGSMWVAGGVGAGSEMVVLVVALLTWALQAVALLPSVRHHRVPGYYAFGLPMAGLLYGLMTLSSAWSHLTRRGVEWKGRRVAGRS